MSDSDSDTDDPNNPNGNDVPKHLRLRYWNSFEESCLVEMWRRFNSEIHAFDKTYPVFRKICDGMRQRGVFVTPEIVKRKISSLKNKYIAESRKLLKSENPCKESDWRLYPLIHCIFAPMQPNSDKCHEEKIVRQAIAELALDSDLDPRLQEEIKENIQFSNSSGINYQSGNASTSTSNVLSSAHQRRNPSGQYDESYSTTGESIEEMSLLIQMHFTAEELENIRNDNRRLAEERDAAMRLLQMEEQEYKIMETLLNKWAEEQEQILFGLDYWKKKQQN